MKATRSIIIGLVAWLMAAAAFAESLPYEFTTVDIPIPGSPGFRAIPEDINDEGEILTNVRINNLAEALIADPVKRKGMKFTTATFSCTGVAFADTSAFSINDKGAIVGYCADAPSAPSKLFGFVRHPSGRHILLDFPGADGTIGYGLSSNGRVVGQYFNPSDGRSGLYRFHGFSWKDGRFKTIDFPRADTYTTLWSVNTRGQIMGEYVTFNPSTNETLEHSWFIYDNGKFILDFPLSLEHVGGPAISLADMNDDGQIVGQRTNGDPDWNGLFLYDDGKFFDIELPAEFAFADVRGMNNKCQFVGMYLVEVGTDSIFGTPIYEQHGYIATPVPRKKSHHFVDKGDDKGKRLVRKAFAYRDLLAHLKNFDYGLQRPKWKWNERE